MLTNYASKYLVGGGGFRLRQSRVDIGKPVRDHNQRLRDSRSGPVRGTEDLCPGYVEARVEVCFTLSTWDCVDCRIECSGRQKVRQEKSNDGYVTEGDQSEMCIRNTYLKLLFIFFITKNSEKHAI